ncbi:hypothetical protein F4604DRAFT_1800454 [Suillus subluteus]|nr:hypothetical protein F4604DRAFT_1800454 [Suillus subluteus]
MYLPWTWPWFGLFGMFLFLNDFGLTSFTKVRPTVQFSFEFWCIWILVTMIPVLGEALIWVPSVLVCACIFSPLFIPCGTCG